MIEHAVTWACSDLGAGSCWHRALVTPRLGLTALKPYQLCCWALVTTDERSRLSALPGLARARSLSLSHLLFVCVCVCVCVCARARVFLLFA